MYREKSYSTFNAINTMIIYPSAMWSCFLICILYIEYTALKYMHIYVKNVFAGWQHVQVLDLGHIQWMGLTQGYHTIHSVNRSFIFRLIWMGLS